ncbi:MAG TPA: hypothetical protein VNL71_03530 [Chloroflexota bacterium]|nr:hypothetical protein [Chloroflexota bacterium]
MSKDDATIIILLIGEASGVFAGFCPSWFTVASPFFHEQEAKAGNVKRIRAGEIAATAIVLATGAAVSARSSNNLPLYASIIISVIFVGGYEYQIAHPSTEDGPGAQSQDPVTIQL